MPLNLNRTSDADFTLKERQAKESIEIFGSPFTYLYTEKMNRDSVLRDFTHLKLAPNKSKIIYLLAEDQGQWEGDIEYNMWGLENLRTITLFMAKETMKDLYPEFDDNTNSGYNKILNTLLVSQGGHTLEIVDVTKYHENANNLFLSDEFSTWKLTTRVYYGSKQNDISPQPEAENSDSSDVLDSNVVGRTDKERVDIGEEMLDLDAYFNQLDNNKIEQDTEGDKISNTDSVFGSLG